MSEVTTLCVVSDTHINSTVGLAAPNTGYERSEQQLKLWRLWLDYWGKANAQPGRKILVHLGDIAELDTKRRSVQIHTGDKASILDQVEKALKPALDVVDGALIIRGTEAHEGRGCWVEEHFAKDIDAIHQGEKYAHEEFQLDANGVRVYLAHHARIGHQLWTRNNAANQLAYKAIVHYSVELRRPVPHLALFGHNHKIGYGRSRLGDHRLEVFQLGAWQLATTYVNSVAQFSKADIGGMFIRCKGDGNYEVEEILYPIRGEPWQTI